MNDVFKAWIARIQYDQDQATKDLLNYYDQAPTQVMGILSFLNRALPDFANAFAKVLKVKKKIP